LEKAEKVADVVLPTGDEAAGVLKPGKEPFDFPAAIATQRSAVLGALAAPAVRRDPLDGVAIAEDRVERVTVVAAVAD
jgi:hypothetical protein